MSKRMTLARAEGIAHEAHKDHFDKQGAPYIQHVMRVAGLVQAACVARLLNKAVTEGDHLPDRQR